MTVKLYETNNLTKKNATTLSRFKLTVKEETEEVLRRNYVRSSHGTNRCENGENLTQLNLVIDKEINAIKPKQRVISINNLAKFFGMPYVSTQDGLFTLITIN